MHTDILRTELLGDALGNPQVMHGVLSNQNYAFDRHIEQRQFFA
ncbi:hypothetical protein ALO43_200492 [Pseudomonas tremae]|uniref:Feruloyl-CoA synthase n=1 Tax=Pseudomonas tremae TaxID=200454 RepID=A0AA40TWU3_9PSED|nr:hypothetical protein ALO43_200492 [Pseudomonas tremae]